MKTLPLYSDVILLRNLPQYSLSAGDVGTIVTSNDLAELETGYNVDFFEANTILSEGFRVSDNDYDWLGEGVYFFQDAPYRAMQWATQQHPQYPAVIRAVIQLDNCIDLLDIKWFPPLKIVYNSFREGITSGYRRFVLVRSIGTKQYL